MQLSKILDGVRVVKLFSSATGKMVLTQDVTVHAIHYDSRRIGRADLFVAIPGTVVDGHRYIDSAIHNGAAVVVVQNDEAMPDPYFMHAGVIKVVVPDARVALATMSANFYGQPSKQLRLIGVTGTNGKTTTTHLIKAVLEQHGERVGLIGTIEYRIGDEVIPATHTTPESLELNELLAAMVGRGCTAAVMEVSSHSLVLSRVHGLDFRAGVFTNLTQDHLDFHRSMDEYARAKKLLFDGLAPDAAAVINAEDSYGTALAGGTKAQVTSYGWQSKATVEAQNVSLAMGGMTLSVAHGGVLTPVASSLTGRFNVSNVLAAYATGVALKIPDSQIADGIARVKAVRGRFEQIPSPAGWMAVVDYAHTPDALEKCLRTIREIISPRTPSRIIAVFGCGGDRDRTKRPIMGRIASELSDITIITSDNPRTEDPGSIIAEVRAGVVRGSNVMIEPDRRAAVRKALGLARTGDVVLLAGKGHEDYQVIGRTKVHLDDHEEVEKFIRDAR